VEENKDGKLPIFPYNLQEICYEQTFVEEKITDCFQVLGTNANGMILP